MDEDSDRNEDENIDEGYYSDKNEDSDEDGENNKNEDENEDELYYMTMTIMTLFLYPLRWDFLRRAKRKKIIQFFKLCGTALKYGIWI